MSDYLCIPLSVASNIIIEPFSWVQFERHHATAFCVFYSRNHLNTCANRFFIIKRYIITVVFCQSEWWWLVRRQRCTSYLSTSWKVAVMNVGGNLSFSQVYNKTILFTTLPTIQIRQLSSIANNCPGNFLYQYVLTEKILLTLNIWLTMVARAKDKTRF